MTERRPPRIVYAGTYERDYGRNRLVIRALRDAGARVEEAHVPVFERRRDKSQLRALGLATLAARLTLAYARLLPGVAPRLLRRDALAVGYIGQLDMLVLAPPARLLGRRVLFNPLVTLTDTLVEDRRLVRAGSLAARAIAALDRAALRLADVVLADTAANGRYLTERFGVDPARIVVVAVGAEDAFAPRSGFEESDPPGSVAPPHRHPERSEAESKDLPASVAGHDDGAEAVALWRGDPLGASPLTPGRSFGFAQDDDEGEDAASFPTVGDDAPLDVLFVGKFIPLHGVDTIIRAAALLRERGVAARFELVGMGQTYAAARALAGALELGPDTLVWTDWIPFERLGDRLRRADVALGIFGAGAKAARVVPNKLYQSLACGTASITRRGPAVEALLRDGEGALLVPPADPDALADAIARLRDRQLRARVGAGGRAAYEARAGRAALAAQVRTALDLLAARDR